MYLYHHTHNLFVSLVTGKKYPTSFLFLYLHCSLKKSGMCFAIPSLLKRVAGTAHSGAICSANLASAAFLSGVLNLGY